MLSTCAPLILALYYSTNCGVWRSHKPQYKRKTQVSTDEIGSYSARTRPPKAVARIPADFESLLPILYLPQIRMFTSFLANVGVWSVWFGEGV